MKDRAAAEQRVGRKLGDVIQPARVALTGTSVSPPIHDVIYLLGREKTVARLQAAVARAEAAAQAKAEG